MKRIVNGKLYDTALATEVASESIDINVAVALGVKASVCRKLYREVVLKPGALLADARTKTSWGLDTWNFDAIDTRRGGFFYVVSCGWTEQTLTPVDERSARRWFEEHFGSDVETYEKYFGTPQTALKGGQDLTGFEVQIRERDTELAQLRKEIEELKQRPDEH